MTEIRIEFHFAQCSNCGRIMRYPKRFEYPEGDRVERTCECGQKMTLKIEEE